MPISGTGTSKTFSNSKSLEIVMKERSRGFTLLEILLVVLLLSVSAAAVMMTFPASQNNQAKAAAQSVFQRIQLLNEEAILSGRDYGVSVDEKQRSLRFLVLTTDGWKLVNTHLFKPVLDIRSELIVNFQLGGDLWQSDERLFEPGSLFDDRFGRQEQEKSPQVFILSSGEVTPFVLSIWPKTEHRDHSWRIVVGENGQARLLAPGEQYEKA